MGLKENGRKSEKEEKEKKENKREKRKEKEKPSKERGKERRETSEKRRRMEYWIWRDLVSHTLPLYNLSLNPLSKLLIKKH